MNWDPDSGSKIIYEDGSTLAGWLYNESDDYMPAIRVCLWPDGTYSLLNVGADPAEEKRYPTLEAAKLMAEML